MAQADREALAQFVGDLEQLLAYVDEDQADLIYVHRREDLSAAWAELRERDGFARLQARLLDPDDPETLDKDLLDRGLTGAQLQAKLKGFNQWLHRAYEDRRRTGRSGRKGRRERKPLRRALSWANILLGSLINIASMGAVGDVIKEMNDLFLESAEDREG